MAATEQPQVPEDAIATEPQLPQLSPSDFRVYNSMAEHMDYFHSRFRQTWKTLYDACCSGKRPSQMSIRQFLSTGLEFCHHIHLHHSIEESHIYPVLATKMPAFQKELELLTQHEQIHQGLGRLQKYLERCKDGEIDLKLVEMKGIMETFGDVLWTHMDDEVKQLGAEYMRKYWTVKEMQRMPM